MLFYCLLSAHCIWPRSSHFKFLLQFQCALCVFCQNVSLSWCWQSGFNGVYCSFLPPTLASWSAHWEPLWQRNMKAAHSLRQTARTHITVVNLLRSPSASVGLQSDSTQYFAAQNKFVCLFETAWTNKSNKISFVVIISFTNHCVYFNIQSPACIFVSLSFDTAGSHIVLLNGDFSLYVLMKFFFLSRVFLLFQRGDWPMHKLECAAMCTYGENWCPSETVRLVARIIMKQVKQ